MVVVKNAVKSFAAPPVADDVGDTVVVRVSVVCIVRVGGVEVIVKFPDKLEEAGPMDDDREAGM